MSLSHSFIIVFGTIVFLTIVFLTILVFLYFTKNRQLLIDVRTNEEWRKNGQRGSTNIPYNQIHTLNVDKSTKIVLYCNSGKRAKIAKETLNILGYNNVEILPWSAKIKPPLGG
jgi:rhodanese-related sulfurtransferase